MSVTRSFPWKTIVFGLLLIIGGLVVYDSNIHGSFAKSSTGKFLKDSGLWDHGQVAFKHGVVYTNQAVAWLNENGPIYYEITKDYLAPYGELSKDVIALSVNLYTDLKEFVLERAPVVLNFVESYAPGLVDKVIDVGLLIWQNACTYFEVVRKYLVTNVFVGQLSPDNLQKVTLEALNTTQIYATRYYDWLYQKVQMLSDIK